MTFYLIIVEERLDNVQNSRRHFVHLIKNEDILSAGCDVPGNPISQLNLVVFSLPLVREVQGRDEQVNKLAVDALGVHALRHKLRHKVLAAPGPAMEAEHQGLGRW